MAPPHWLPLCFEFFPTKLFSLENGVSTSTGCGCAPASILTFVVQHRAVVKEDGIFDHVGAFKFGLYEKAAMKIEKQRELPHSAWCQNLSQFAQFEKMQVFILVSQVSVIIHKFIQAFKYTTLKRKLIRVYCLTSGKFNS